MTQQQGYGMSVWKLSGGLYFCKHTKSSTTNPGSELRSAGCSSEAMISWRPRTQTAAMPRQGVHLHLSSTTHPTDASYRLSELVLGGQTVP